MWKVLKMNTLRSLTPQFAQEFVIHFWQMLVRTVKLKSNIFCNCLAAVQFISQFAAALIAMRLAKSSRAKEFVGMRPESAPKRFCAMSVTCRKPRIKQNLYS